MSTTVNLFDASGSGNAAAACAGDCWLVGDDTSKVAPVLRDAPPSPSGGSQCLEDDDSKDAVLAQGGAATAPPASSWASASAGFPSWAAGFEAVLKQVHPDADFAPAGRERVMQYVCSVGDAIVKHCVAASDGGTVDGGQVRDATSAVLSGELMKHANSEATKAEAKFSGGDGSADLQFVHADVKAAATTLSGGAVTWSDAAAVCLAATLEYMSAEVLEPGGYAARDDGHEGTRPGSGTRGTIDSKHIDHAIANDEELSASPLREAESTQFLFERGAKADGEGGAAALRSGGGENQGSLFCCGRCGSDKTQSHQMQTRSADEPITVFLICMNCGNRWKEPGGLLQYG